MILQSLVDLYEVLAKKGEVDRFGWWQVEVSYGLVLDKDGRLIDVISLKIPASKGEKEIGQSMSVPMQDTRTSNVKSYFLCDRSSYFLGSDKKSNAERNRKCFENARKLHNEVLFGISTDSVQSILSFFENWNLEKAEEVLKEIGCSESVIVDILRNRAKLVLLPLGRFPSDYSEICSAWDNYYENDYEKNCMCLVKGQNLKFKSVHPVIKGIVGAEDQMTLVSANKIAFESYGKSKGDNAQVSKYAAFAYATALNYLLRQKKYVKFFGDTTIVCWTSDYNDGYQNLMAGIFDENINLISQSDLWNSVRRLSRGLTVDWEGNYLNPENRFYVLGLVPQEGRVSVRFFLENTFGEFMKNVQLHNEQINIALPDYLKNSNFSVWKILKETVRRDTKTKDEKEEKNIDFKLVKPQLAGDLIYSVLTGNKYPATLYNSIMIRIRAERTVNKERAAIRTAIIKAYILRNYPDYNKEALTVKLNLECTDKAYVLGRLFSLLEEIQDLANPKKDDNYSKSNINTTIKDSYFSSASSTPAVVFPKLIDLAQKHLKKIRINEYGKCIAKQKELTELISKLDEELPSTMTMQEKGVFQIGYYHQTQQRFTKKEDK